MTKTWQPDSAVTAVSIPLLIVPSVCDQATVSASQPDATCIGLCLWMKEALRRFSLHELNAPPGNAN